MLESKLPLLIILVHYEKKLGKQFNNSINDDSIVF